METRRVSIGGSGESGNNKGRPLQKMFLSVPPSYDLLNRLLTLRFDIRWRRMAGRVLLKENPVRVLDLCCGTGDMAIEIRNQAMSKTEVWGLDYSEPMLWLAIQKSLGSGQSNGRDGRKKNIHDYIKGKRSGLARREINGLPGEGMDANGIRFIHGDAAMMPFADGFFDAVGIAFAFRNLTYMNPDTARFLEEIKRVLKPGGLFVVVETSQPRHSFLRKAMHAYLRYIAAPLGSVISGNKAAYRYLAHSAIHYHDADQVSAILHGAGFRDVKYRPLLGGIAAIWRASMP